MNFPSPSIPSEPLSPAVRVRHLSLWYGAFQAMFDLNLEIKQGIITSLIGTSGCGKSTLLRSVDRINERLGTVRIEGTIEVLGHDIHGPDVALAPLRKQVGMVFQRPNPLPISVFDNVLFGHRLHRHPGLTVSPQEEAELVENALRTVLLWDTVKDRLHQKATAGLSLEEQQKLCIARLLPVKPAVLLMDEPCSALDPKGTAAVEELLWTLRGEYSILLVTHNMAQARRASDECLFLLMGRVMEHGETAQLFLAPTCPETADYIEGRYG